MTKLLIKTAVPVTNEMPEANKSIELSGTTELTEDIDSNRMLDPELTGIGSPESFQNSELNNVPDLEMLNIGTAGLIEVTESNEMTQPTTPLAPMETPDLNDENELSAIATLLTRSSSQSSCDGEVHPSAASLVPLQTKCNAPNCKQLLQIDRYPHYACYDCGFRICYRCTRLDENADKLADYKSDKTWKHEVRPKLEGKSKKFEDYIEMEKDGATKFKHELTSEPKYCAATGSFYHRDADSSATYRPLWSRTGYTDIVDLSKSVMATMSEVVSSLES